MVISLLVGHTTVLLNQNSMAATPVPAKKRDVKAVMRMITFFNNLMAHLDLVIIISIAYEKIEYKQSNTKCEQRNKHARIEMTALKADVNQTDTLGSSP